MKVREFPQYFRDYRKDERSAKLKPVRRKEWRETVAVAEALTPEEKAEFKRLNKTVEKAARAFVDAGLALIDIREKKLYREKHATFEDYCLNVHNISRSYAYHLAKAGKIYREMSTIVDNADIVLGRIKHEAQVRELGRLPDAQSRLEMLELLPDEDEPLTAKRISEAVDARLNAIPRPTRSPSPSKRIEEVRHVLEELEATINEGVTKESLEAFIQRFREHWASDLSS